MRRLYGPCPGCALGKITRAPSTAISLTTSNLGERIEFDIVFYYGSGGSKIPYLQAIEDRVGHLSILRLSNKTADNVLAALRTIFAYYRAHGYTAKYGRCDREAVFTACQASLLQSGIILERTSTDRHASTVERSVRLIRDKMRATTALLPYKLPGALCPQLLEDIVSSCLPSYPSGTYHWS
jgi:hypothetical protein